MSNPISNATDFQNQFGIGLSTNDLEILTNLGKAAYGSGRSEGVRGGKGYLGVFVDQLGECHVVKMLTHASERSFSAKSDIRKMLNGSSDGAQAAKEASDNFERLLLTLAAQATKPGAEGEENFFARVQAKIQAYKDSLQIGGKEATEPNQVLYSRRFTASVLEMFSTHIANREESDIVKQGMRDDPEKEFRVTNDTVAASIHGFKFTAEKFTRGNRAATEKHTTFKAIGTMRGKIQDSKEHVSEKTDESIKYFETKMPKFIDSQPAEFSESDFQRMKNAIAFLAENGVKFGEGTGKYSTFKKLVENFEQFQSDLNKHMYRAILFNNYGITTHPENLYRNESDRFYKTIPNEQRNSLVRQYNKMVMNGFMWTMTTLVDAIRSQPREDHEKLIHDLNAALQPLCYEATISGLNNLLFTIKNTHIYDQRGVVYRAMAVIGDFMTDNKIEETKDLTPKDKSRLIDALSMALENQEIEVQELAEPSPRSGNGWTIGDPGEKKIIPDGYAKANFHKLIAYYRTEIAMEDDIPT